MIDLVIIGAGPAGLFGAIAAKSAHPSASVVILEKSNRPLAKLLRTGGGRCNLTNAKADHHTLSDYYPRGAKELIGSFSRFSFAETMQWFEDHGVSLITEKDGRVFPASGQSETIANCLLRVAFDLGVEIRLNQTITHVVKKDGTFQISLTSADVQCENLMIATGSNAGGYQLSQGLGHTIHSPVPSLFPLEILNFTLKELSGVVIEPVSLFIDHRFTQTGSLLITHFGFSGPAALKLSSFYARDLSDQNYRCPLYVNWLPRINHQQIVNALMKLKVEYPRQMLLSANPFSLPHAFWKTMVSSRGLKRLCDISKKEIDEIADHLQKDSHQITARAAQKEEFVTCGGVFLKEISFQTMESKICSRLFFAGEVLDIDAITGGFNLQNAWTTGFIAGSSIYV